MVQIKSSCDLFIHHLCNSIEKLSCLGAVISAFFFFLNNPGFMQPHNFFVSLGCVQFVNLCYRRAIKTVRHRPRQSKTETEVEFQLR